MIRVVNCPICANACTTQAAAGRLFQCQRCGAPVRVPAPAGRTPARRRRWHAVGFTVAALAAAVLILGLSVRYYIEAESRRKTEAWLQEQELARVKVEADARAAAVAAEQAERQKEEARERDRVRRQQEQAMLEEQRTQERQAQEKRRRQLQQEFDLWDSFEDRQFILEARDHMRAHPHDVSWLAQRAALVWGERNSLSALGKFLALTPEVSADDFREAVRIVGDAYGAGTFANTMRITDPKKLAAVGNAFGLMTDSQAKLVLAVAQIVATQGYQAVPPELRRVIRAHPDLFPPR
ncbi:MAG TPA: hypothetical protein VGF55_19455 [Gemmataceae bacterium]|jgi:hypothetical protein